MMSKQKTYAALPATMHAALARFALRARAMLLAGTCLAAPGVAHAESWSEVYSQALENDVQLRVAYNGTPPEILANAELMSLLLPAVRADFALVHDYVYRHPPPHLPPLHLSLTVLAGTADPAGAPEQVSRWREETSGPCDVQWFERDHFFIHTCTKQVIACIDKALHHITEPAR